MLPRELALYHSRKRGIFLISRIQFQAGQLICTYTGIIIDKQDIMKVNSVYNDKILQIGDKYIVGTGAAAYAGHHCTAPNAHFAHNDKHILLIANRSIQVGELITVNYLYNLVPHQRAFSCHCGAFPDDHRPQGSGSIPRAPVDVPQPTLPDTFGRFRTALWWRKGIDMKEAVLPTQPLTLEDLFKPSPNVVPPPPSRVSTRRKRARTVAQLIPLSSVTPDS